MTIRSCAAGTALAFGHFVAIGARAQAQMPESLRPSIATQIDVDRFGRDSIARSQIGALPGVGEVRILRPQLEGRLHWPFEWRYLFTLEVTSSYRQNMHGTLFPNFIQLTFPISHVGNLVVGKQREGVSMQMFESRQYQPFMERAPVVTAFLPTRNDGVRLGNTALDDRLGWSLGAFNSWLTNNLTFPENGSQLNGRIYGSPILKDDARQLVHVGLSARWSEAQLDSLRFRSRPQANGAPNFIDTKQLATNGATMLGGELALVHGPASLTSELLGTRVNQDPTSRTFYGYYAELSWFPRGEFRKYEKSSGTLRRVEMGDHINTFEIALNFNHTNLTSGDVDGGILDRGNLALSWYRRRGLRFEINAGLGRLDRSNTVGRTSFLLSRVQWYLE